jgi:hypothetical protein
MRFGAPFVIKHSDTTNYGEHDGYSTDIQTPSRGFSIVSFNHNKSFLKIALATLDLSKENTWASGEQQ